MKQFGGLAIFCTLVASCVTSNSPKVVSLASAGIRYTTDGHGGSDTLKRPGVQDFLAGERAGAVPILIRHLADQTPTNSNVNGESGVSLGYVCFDVPCHILKPTQWFDMDCGDCGLWSAVRPDYSIPIKITPENHRETLAAQERWQRLLDSGDLVPE